MTDLHPIGLVSIPQSSVKPSGMNFHDCNLTLTSKSNSVRILDICPASCTPWATRKILRWTDGLMNSLWVEGLDCWSPHMQVLSISRRRKINSIWSSTTRSLIHTWLKTNSHSPWSMIVLTTCAVQRSFPKLMPRVDSHLWKYGCPINTAAPSWHHEVYSNLWSCGLDYGMDPQPSSSSWTTYSEKRLWEDMWLLM